MSYQGGDPKTYLSTLSPEAFRVLQNTFYYRWIANLLRSTGWLNVFLGGLTLWLALDSGGASISFLQLIQGLLGVMILGVSLWAITRPSTTGILGYSLLFLVTGAWNILVALLGGLDGLLLLIGALGGFQLFWAYQYYNIYRRYAPKAVTTPTAEDSYTYHELWNRLVKPQPASQDPDFVTLRLQQDVCQGFLLKDRMALAHLKRKMIVLAYANEATFTPETSPTTSKKLVSGRFVLDVITTKAHIPKSVYENYLLWKSAASAGKT